MAEKGRKVVYRSIQPLHTYQHFHQNFEFRQRRFLKKDILFDDVKIGCFDNFGATLLQLKAPAPDDTHFASKPNPPPKKHGPIPLAKP